MKKIIRTATIALSLDVLLKGQLAFLSDKFTVIAVSGNDKHLNTVQDREGVKTINVAFQRKISPLKDIVSLLNLYRVLRKEKPLIVHSITPKAGLITMVAGYFARVPIRMHTFTGLIFPTKKGVVKQLLIFMDKILCLFATNIYPEGQGVKNDLQQFQFHSFYTFLSKKTEEEKKKPFNSAAEIMFTRKTRSTCFAALDRKSGALFAHWN